MDVVVETIGLTKRFGPFTTLDSLSLSVGAGEVFGYLGPNGAGKTTTIRLLLGLLRPSAGSARIAGIDPWADPVATHAHLAYVPGEFPVWPQLTGAEMLTLLANLHGGTDATYQAELVERFDLDVSKRGRTYSKGNRQKIALIAALATRAEVLVLDEPTSGLDPLMEVEFRRCIEEARANGQAVFLSSHILSEVEMLCDRVGILRNGRLVEIGSLDSLRRLAALNVEVIFGGPAIDLSGVTGVTIVDQGPDRVHLTLRGEPGPLLAALAGARVHSFISREPDLEELFLTYYGSGR